jgi:hypothetical protein
MTIAMSCDECGKRSNVPYAFAGRRGRCKGCGAPVVVPHPRSLSATPPPGIIDIEAWPARPREAMTRPRGDMR